MSIITELVAPPQHIHEKIATFQESFRQFAASLPARSALRQCLVPLWDELSGIVTALTKSNLDASATSKIVDRWDAWCERFGQINDPLFEEELEHLFIAMPQ